MNPTLVLSRGTPVQNILATKSAVIKVVFLIFIKLVCKASFNKSIKKLPK